jgi:hypothetical protein
MRSRCGTVRSGGLAELESVRSSDAETHTAAQSGRSLPSVATGPRSGFRRQRGWRSRCPGVYRLGVGSGRWPKVRRHLRRNLDDGDGDRRCHAQRMGLCCPPRASVMWADRPRGEMPASVLVLPDGSVRALLRRRPADHSRGRTASRPRRSRSRGAFAVPLMTQRQSTLAGLPGHGFMRILAASLSPVQRPACGDNQTTAPQTRLLTLRRLSSASFSPGQSSISAASRYEHIAKASCSSGRASDSSARDLCTQRRESPGDEKEAQRYADLAASLKWDGDVCRESLALRRRSCFSATRLMDMATTCPASVPRRNGK